MAEGTLRTEYPAARPPEGRCAVRDWDWALVVEEALIVILAFVVSFVPGFAVGYWMATVS